MNLVIDQGNTVCKLAVFNADEMILRKVVPELNDKLLTELFQQYPEIEKSILASSGYFSDAVSKRLSEKLSYHIILDSSTPLPIKNTYESRDTLGYDRIAGAVGAFSLLPGKDVLIIDAGTAITIDLLTSNGEFYGGNISPGLNLRFRALHEFTSRLPLVEKKESYPLTGRNTEDAILAGVMNGATFEIDSYIDHFKKQFPGIKIILTGGDINYFEKKLKNSIFVHSNLNLTGLNRILEYNAENK